ncbi:MAG: tyrosine-protein phosphatase [bacterium]|nr:tyrosine-protein phosphatase [Gammaproteobacteria bacterium]
MINNYSERHHPFEGCFNFRDIGGYEAADGRTVRWGRYFRAGRQDRMTSDDLDKVKELGIRTQIDLRRPDEALDQGRGPLEGLGANYENIAVIPEGGTDQLSRLVGDTGISGKRYLGYLGFGPESWIRMFEIFAKSVDHPVLVHCTAGKDRTGVTTAFLLSILGVERALIEADYILTNRDVDRQVTFLENTVGLPEGMSREYMMRVAGVPEDAMSDFLDGLDENYDGALGYLRSIGIDDEIQETIREEYLEG